MNRSILVFGIQKRISDSAVQKSTIALMRLVRQHRVRDFDFCVPVAFSACTPTFEPQKIAARNEVRTAIFLASNVALPANFASKFLTNFERGFSQAGVVAPPESPNFGNFHVFG